MDHVQRCKLVIGLGQRKFESFTSTCKFYFYLGLADLSCHKGYVLSMSGCVLLEYEDAVYAGGRAQDLRSCVLSI